MGYNDLTTLPRVKDWLTTKDSETDSDSSSVLSALISSVSGAMLAHMARDTVFSKSFTDYYDGYGSPRLSLKRFPVTSITSLTIGAITIPVNPSPPYNGSGYFLEPWDGQPPGMIQCLILNGYVFPRGKANIQLVSNSGYLISNEAAVVPASTPYHITPLQPQGLLMYDAGVTFASNGVALVAVASNPAAGQYVPPNPQAAPARLYYTFAAADTGAAVNLNYSYVPSVIEKACIDLVGERFRYRDRIGQRSKTMGQTGETINFELKDLPDFVKWELQPYRRTVPI